jgi:hypothetical protein
VDEVAEDVTLDVEDAEVVDIGVVDTIALVAADVSLVEALVVDCDGEALVI